MTLVVKAFDYELRETDCENKIFVLIEKGDKSLFHILSEHRSNRTLSSTKLKFFWEQMLEAVQQVHDCNIVHSDLKPGNFLLVCGNLKLIDFGLAIEMTEASLKARKCTSGTKGYMPPESLCAGVQISKKTDVWALGIILYQAVFGVHPFPVNKGVTKGGHQN